MRTFCDVLFGFTIGFVIGSIICQALEVGPDKPTTDVDDGRVYFIFVDDKGNKVDGSKFAERFRPEGSAAQEEVPANA